MKEIEQIHEPALMRQVVNQLRLDGKRVGLVPTMGALHEGHLSLVRRSNEQNDETVVTIFVNPTQFAPTEDLAQYPRPLEKDLQLLQAEGVRYVFLPTPESMYPQGCSTEVKPPNIAKRLESEFRPTHFTGVATVVLKLINIVGADIAFFGQKDFQQAAVIKQMVRDLNVPVEISVEPIVREKDGLALSSRNVYLSEEERTVALSLSQTLKHVEQQIKAGQIDAYELVTEMRQMLIDGGVTSIDYATVANAETLEVEDPLNLPVVALIAAHVGKTRLIDNVVVEKS